MQFRISWSFELHLKSQYLQTTSTSLFSFLGGIRLPKERCHSGKKRPTHFFSAVWALFRNPTWSLIAVALTVETGAVVAFATFLPKLLQFQYKMTSSRAAIATGDCRIFMISAGRRCRYLSLTLLHGYVTSVH